MRLLEDGGSNKIMVNLLHSTLARGIEMSIVILAYESYLTKFTK